MGVLSYHRAAEGEGRVSQTRAAMQHLRYTCMRYIYPRVVTRFRSVLPRMHASWLLGMRLIALS